MGILEAKRKIMAVVDEVSDQLTGAELMTLLEDVSSDLQLRADGLEEEME